MTLPFSLAPPDGAPGISAKEGLLWVRVRQPRFYVIFHWNRAALSRTEQALLAESLSNGYSKMFAGETPLGCSALLRVAGLPVRYWLAGANPTLFEKVERLERDEEVRHACAIQLAERIGEQLVPNPALSRDDRAFLLDVRRTLHRGDLVAKVSRERLLKVSGLSAADAELVQALVAMVDRDRATAMLSAEVEADLAQEQDRLLLLPEQIYHESQVARALLLPRDPDGARARVATQPEITPAPLRARVAPHCAGGNREHAEGMAEPRRLAPDRSCGLAAGTGGH